jgi:selenocysteine-specific translation elongation factor
MRNQNLKPPRESKNPVASFLADTDPAPRKRRLSQREVAGLLQNQEERRLSQQVRNKLRLGQHGQALLLLLPYGLRKLTAEELMGVTLTLIKEDRRRCQSSAKT